MTDDPASSLTEQQARKTRAEGLEPPTAGFGIRCSAKLSYTRKQPVHTFGDADTTFHLKPKSKPDSPRHEGTSFLARLLVDRVSP